MRIKNTLFMLLAILLAANLTLFGEQDETASDYIPIIPLLDAELIGLDIAHSYLGFNIGFLGLNKVRGTFNTYDMAFLYNEKDLTQLSFTLVIDAASIDTRMEMRDKDLRGERFFEVEKYPNIIFQSNRIEKNADGFIAHGNLTMRGVTKAIAVPFTQTVQRTKDPGWQNIRIGFEGRISLNRKDYGVNGGNFWGNRALSDEVEIEFTILGNKFNLEKFGFARGDIPSIGKPLWEAVLADDGKAALKKYHELKANQPDDYNFKMRDIGLVGKRLMYRGDIDSALEFLNIVLAEEPEDKGHHLALGEAYALKSDRAKAIEHFRKAQELDPNDPWAMEMLRQLERKK